MRIRYMIAVLGIVSLVSIQPHRAQAGPVLWIDDAFGNIGTVDVATGDTHVIGSSGVTLTDIAFDVAGFLWGITHTNLYQINRDTGAATLVGATGLSQGNALVFGSDGTLYAADGFASQLFTIDTATGAATSIGAINSSSGGDLAFYNGSLYLTSITGKLVQISLSPVSGTLVGPTGFLDVYGMATGDDNILYGVAGTRIFSIDETTGTGTLVRDYGGNGLGTANGTAFVNEAPEPATIAMLALGGSLLIRRKRPA